MKSKLKPAPFPVGAIVEYIGERIAYNGETPCLIKGMRFEIVKIYEPRKGDGKIGVDEEGEPIIDYDEDGCSMYNNACGGRLIYPEKAHEYKRVQ